MAQYLRLFWEVLKDDVQLRFSCRLLDIERNDEEGNRMRALLPVTEVSASGAYCREWDLVVVADHSEHDLLDSGRFRTLYIGHGPVGKSTNGGQQTYSYGPRAFTERGRLRYTRMFEESEANRDLAVSRDARLSRAIAVVGNPWADKALRALKDRSEFRERLGLRAEDFVVFVLSSWGPESLCHTMGDGILQEAVRLYPEIRFIFTVHPNEYRARADGGRVWGEYLRTYGKKGILVREPSESWIPYMVAADAVLSDHTGLWTYAAMLDRPVIFVPVPGEALWPGSVAASVRHVAPVLSDPGNLRRVVLEVKRGYPFEQLREAAKRMCSYPGRSAERIREEVYNLLQISPSC